MVVTIAHAWGNIEAPIEEWIRIGPGPRPFTEIIRARKVSTGEDLPLSEIPIEYHNSPEARRLQRRGLLRSPWGDPPPEPGEGRR